ncbi:hypothetical protein ACQB6R_04265 [Propionibacteriaceae bacterium G1746]|uniref:hypothetical protein n=1 Tax=Aestuariimicrobium sp. G57 TaxID=3418485 RepID=UPI003C1FFB27
MAEDHSGEWYYCLIHKTVEPYDGCKAGDRLGPYRSQAEAAQALEHAAERNEDWDNDPRFNDPDEDDDNNDEKDEDEGSGWGPFKS